LRKNISEQQPNQTKKAFLLLLQASCCFPNRLLLNKIFLFAQLVKKFVCKFLWTAAENFNDFLFHLAVLRTLAPCRFFFPVFLC